MNLLPKIVETQLTKTPYEQFLIWYDWVLENDRKEEGTVILATVSPEGEPLQRAVLIKEHSPSSLVFFTNYSSQKAQHIAANPQVCLLFPWSEFGGQVIIKGKATKTSREVSEKYIRKRARGSQISSMASRQSQPLESRASLIKKVEEIDLKFKGKELEIPEYWGGYSITPDSYEFWQAGHDRLHDRFRYTREESLWVSQRYSP